MNAETIGLKKYCLQLIGDYDEAIRALFAKIEPDLMAHAKSKKEYYYYIDIDSISIDPVGIFFKAYSHSIWDDDGTNRFYLPWTHFNIDR